MLITWFESWCHVLQVLYIQAFSSIILKQRYYVPHHLINIVFHFCNAVRYFNWFSLKWPWVTVTLMQCELLYHMIPKIIRSISKIFWLVFVVSQHQCNRTELQVEPSHRPITRDVFDIIKSLKWKINGLLPCHWAHVWQSL